MKPVLLILWLLIPIALVAQTFPKVTYNPKNCSLTIKAGKWIKNGSKELLPVTAILYNNSNDTLKYASELCFEGEFGYLPDTTNFSIVGAGHDCLKNWDITIAIPPHSRKTEKLNLVKKFIGVQQVNLQLVTTLELVNIDVHLVMMKAIFAKKNGFEIFESKFSLYKTQNTHIFRSNILKI